MKKSIKIRLFPTEEQRILMFKTFGCSRFTYNWALNKCQELYKQGINFKMSDIRKEFTQIKKQEEFKWLNEVSNTTLVEAMRNLDKAYKSFLKKISKKPKFKSRKSKQSFYIRYDRMYFKNGYCNIEKIGKVKYKTNYKIPDTKYSNPYCSFDGKYFYLSFGFEHNENQVMLNKDLSIGIDLGISYLAVVNKLDKPILNINKTKKVRKLKKRLKRLQRQISRKYEKLKCGKTFNKAISEQCFHEFSRQIEYKCKFNGIEFIKADRFYPSSKTCSKCGTIKKDLKLKDRVFKCDSCNFVIDRDKNASINLSQYKLA